ncbi:MULTISPECIES: SH3 domain-containing C40 family peptidase [Legionella]|uniref:SH3 domain-containing C40 family peptidase n=1 Tax=Legionella TaxID=445 RepID=UPI000AB95DD2|nr:MULTISPECIES: SH3 domain-containing C40 family peptidase [Legionella]MBN9226396.1 SH3 domain-containing protein [Legionella steelei]
MRFGLVTLKYMSRRFLLLGIFFLSAACATEVPIYDFSIKPYSQNINDYFPSDSDDYELPLLKPEYQAAQLLQFYNHYYADSPEGLSPWSERMVVATLPTVKKIELEILKEYDNQNKANEERHYAENFKEHDALWLNRIQRNMDLPAIETLAFNEKNKAIAVNNTFARALPEHAPDFYHFTIPGQGFPFDNLQESVIWAGTPLYVFTMSQDKSWSLVLTPDAYFAWVKSSDIAYASTQFIEQWKNAAKKGLVAITETETSVMNQHHHFELTGYIGAVFPFVGRDDNDISILIPVKNEHHQAVTQIGVVSSHSASVMPLEASKKNMAKILKQLQNRPYGWGGAFFFNDCSQELKSLFTPFGIWLPRNSAQQAKISSGVDLTKNTVDERIRTLKTQGHPLMTLIYIGGHVMLYLGNRSINHEEAAMTYQNIWGLSPASRDKRYVIGQALFFPLLKYYPENPDISSLANKSYFKMIYLDELNTKGPTPEAFSHTFMKPASPNLSF